MVSLTAFRFAAAAADPAPLLLALAEAEGGGRRADRNWSTFLSPGQSHRAFRAHAGRPASLFASVRHVDLVGRDTLGRTRSEGCHSNLLRGLAAIGWFAAAVRRHWPVAHKTVRWLA